MGFDDGSSARFHVLALRDGCPCGDCRHPLSGQRFFETPEVLLGTRATSLELSDGVLAIYWHDGHLSEYPAGWLAEESRALALGRRPARDPTLWDASLADRLPTASYGQVCASASARAVWLEAVAGYGFALLEGVPVSDGAVAEVAELFGPVRVTNYGRVFDVRTRTDATNLADSALALSLHTDNPYRLPPPTLQLLACLTSTVQGGETVLADGFRAVSVLAAEAPDLPVVLAATPIRFAYRDAETELSAEVPVISLDTRGDPLALQLNNRSKGTPLGTPGEVERWYRAYLHLLAILGRHEAQVVFRLEPGHVLVFDNQRVLHGRKGFSGEGSRHLQGCYADRDALVSSLELLHRGLT